MHAHAHTYTRTRTRTHTHMHTQHTQHTQHMQHAQLICSLARIVSFQLGVSCLVAMGLWVLVRCVQVLRRVHGQDHGRTPTGRHPGFPHRGSADPGVTLSCQWLSIMLLLAAFRQIPECYSWAAAGQMAGCL